MVTYGGGHAQIMAVLAREMLRRGHEPVVLGLTTAFAQLRRDGLPVVPVTELLTDGDAELYAAARPHVPWETQHPDVPPEHTQAYFAIGFADLVAEHGVGKAEEHVARLGRKAFLPERTFRRYIEHLAPDCVVTTTSPRFELAAVRAARAVQVPSVAVSDLFLRSERQYILDGLYADHLTLICEQVAEELRAAGLRQTRTHVTGNPAFDRLAEVARDESRRGRLRAELGLENKTVVLWSAAPRPAPARYGREFAGAEDVVALLDPMCVAHPEYAYIYRPHPNSTESPPGLLAHGLLDPGLKAADALLVADVVWTELSTMGLQGALMGKRVTCVGFGAEAGYPAYGLARAVASISEAITVELADPHLVRPTTLPVGFAPLGYATPAVADLIESVCGVGGYNS